MGKSKKEIAERLKMKGATLSCHRCGKNTFSIMDGYSKFIIQTNINELPNTELSVPVILIACNNCGAITPHAKGALDLLLKEEQKNA